MRDRLLAAANGVPTPAAEASWLQEHLGTEVPEVKARDGQLEAYVPRKRKEPAASGVLPL